MKIVFYTNRMTSGGSERVISYLANAFAEQHDVTIVTMTCAKSDYYLTDKVKHQSLENRPAKNNHSLFKNISRIYKLKRYIQRNPDALYISFVTLPSYILLMLEKYVKKGKVIVTVRNDPKASHKHWYDRLLVKWLYPKADALVFQTPEAEKFYDFIKVKSSVILPNPVNEKFMRTPYAGERKKEIVSVGRLIEQKNQKMLIDAFASIYKQFPDYCLKIYGEGYLRDKLQTQIKELKMESSIKLQGSVVDLQDKIYDAALFVLSSDFEGMPNVLLEAMSLGLPVISTKCSGGGPEMIINNGVNGLLTPIGDSKSMAEAIKKVLSDPLLAEKMSVNASRISERFSQEGTIKCWEEFLRQYFV